MAKKKKKLQNITNNKFDIGISTGIISSFMVLDIDSEDKGREYLKNYNLRIFSFLLPALICLSLGWFFKS